MTELLQPSKATLKKYGLTPESWAALADRQGRVCFVCRKLPKTGRLHIDHLHVKNWKKLPDEQRAATCRGLLCHWCNRSYVGRCITAEKSRRVTEYLERFAAMV
jgi:hypothetical protein